MNDTIIINAASTPATTPTASAGKQRRLIIATSLGNGLEIFDFTIYSFFASLIGSIELGQVTADTRFNFFHPPLG
ncbi:hypothetical protein [Pseudomonas sp. 6D_7.1_Bac1]|uniref:hypothetical protein n=1 Tax=Pseudomonas sp. 6D_7.1_Bac1 TaxID=2971615 RepID=UPI0021C75BC8|nr:hypothetical protein [Pseudomonas sp. 6D_7.1_Bac1]MCU1753222.1 hypothetical protein [Pseudomonas sp. 6D_7.1_Bac1]